MESSWSSGLPRRFVALNWLLFSMNICLQTKFKNRNKLANFVAKFVPNFRTWKHKLASSQQTWDGNCALKSDLKSTINVLLKISTHGRKTNKNVHFQSKCISR